MMTRKPFPRSLAACLLSGGVLACAMAWHGESAARPSGPLPGRNLLAGTPVLFEPNQGQAPDEARFTARVGSQQIYLSGAGSTMLLAGYRPEEAAAVGRDANPADRPPLTTAVVRMRLVGSDRDAPVEGLQRQKAYTNYFLGSDPARWKTHVPNYSRVRCRGVYPGIDLVYYSDHQGGLEHDFVVAPGADPAAIALQFSGADRVLVDDRGDLVLETPVGRIRHRRPLTYQVTGGGRREVPSRYVLHPGGRVTFRLGGYDDRLPLVIDPAMSYSTYVGAGGAEQGRNGAVDSSGNAYLPGSVTQNGSALISPNTKLTGSGHGFTSSVDIFVQKVQPPSGSGNATVAWTTYIGGGGNDFGNEVKIGDDGGVYLVAETNGGLPTPNSFNPSYGGGQSDGYVCKLAANGASVLYGGYVGSNTTDILYGVGVYSDGTDQYAFVSGYTLGVPTGLTNAFDTTNSGNDAVVGEIKDPTGGGNATVVWLSLHGGEGTLERSFGADAHYASGTTYLVAVGRSDSAGMTPVRAFDTTHTGREGWLAYYNRPTGGGNASVSAMSFYGGNADDELIGVSLQKDGTQVGRAAIAGSANSTDLSGLGLIPNAYDSTRAGVGNVADAVVAIVRDPGGGGNLVVDYGTYIGGDGYDHCRDTAVVTYQGTGDSSAQTRLFAGGRSDSSINFVTKNATQASGAGQREGWFARFIPSLSGNASAEEVSLWGGSSTDEIFGIGARVDLTPNPDTVRIVLFGQTFTNNDTTPAPANTFPIFRASQPTFGGNTSDAFISEINPDAALEIANVRIFNVTTNQATWSWDTNAAADTRVVYSADGVNVFTGTASPNNDVFKHTLVLTGLTPSTHYQGRALSDNAASDEAKSALFDFITCPPNPKFTVTLSSSSRSGGTLTFNINVKNTGFGTATDVRVTSATLSVGGTTRNTTSATPAVVAASLGVNASAATSVAFDGSAPFNAGSSGVLRFTGDYDFGTIINAAYGGAFRVTLPSRPVRQGGRGRRR